MGRRLHTFLAVVVLSLAWGCVAGAQEDAFAPQVEPAAHPERKQPSFFHRPARRSPAAQLAFARELEADGRARAARRQYQALVHTWHDSEEAAAAQAALARLLEQARRYRRAFEEYQYLLDHYAGLFPYEEALAGQFRIANLLRTWRRGRFLFFPGFAAPEAALPLFEQIVENAPGWHRAAEAQFAIGLIRQELGDEEEAVQAFERLQRRYPDSDFVAGAAYRRAACLDEIARAQMRDEQSCRRALSALSGCLRDYPEHKAAAEARERMDRLNARLARMSYERALFYDRDGKHPRAALIAYRDFLQKFPSAERSDRAAERIAALRRTVEEEHESE